MKLFTIASALLCVPVSAMIELNGETDTIDFDGGSMVVNASSITFDLPIIAKDFSTVTGRSLLADMDAHEHNQASNFTNIGAKVDAMATSITLQQSSLDGKMNAMDGKMDALVTAVANLATAMAGISANVSAISTSGGTLPGTNGSNPLTAPSPAPNGLSGTPPSWLVPPAGWIRSGLNDETLTGSTSASGGLWCHANGKKSSGKWYAEMHINEFTPITAGFGLHSPTHGVAGQWAMVWKERTPLTVFHCPSHQDRTYGPLNFFDAGNNVGIAIDLDAGQLQFFLNGVSMGDVPAGGPNYATDTFSLMAYKGSGRPMGSMSLTILDQHVYAAPSGYAFWTA